ncbi:MAG: TIGR01459 family HAD-type hydrolase [Rhodospirillaceae bacterium]|nr:TIGR01459 family HAD-type hydrolase [Rhodospirillaceae bacterium]
MNESIDIPILSGLAPLMADYDGCILDVWGVMHQGGPAYPEALTCVRQLRAAGKRVVFLSNAPRLAPQVESVLNGKGVDATLYDAVIASGDAARLALADRARPPVDGLGTRYRLLGPPGSDDVLDGLGYTAAADVETAEFLFGIGLDDASNRVEDHEPILQAAAARGLPMICVNPDLLVIRLGVQEPCAGALAARYEQIGGRVRYFGKPYPDVYDLALAKLGLPPARVLAVGDALATDIAGANAAGLDSVLITGGLLADELDLAPGEAPSARDLEQACRAAGVRPRAALAAFVW